MEKGDFNLGKLSGCDHIRSDLPMDELASCCLVSLYSEEAKQAPEQMLTLGHLGITSLFSLINQVIADFRGGATGLDLILVNLYRPR